MALENKLLISSVFYSFCEGMKARPMKVLKEVAQYMGSAGEEIAMRSAVPQMRMDISMLNEIINLEDLPKMYRRLNDQVNYYSNKCNE